MYSEPLPKCRAVHRNAIAPRCHSVHAKACIGNGPMPNPNMPARGSTATFEAKRSSCHLSTGFVPCQPLGSVRQWETFNAFAAGANRIPLKRTASSRFPRPHLRDSGRSKLKKRLYPRCDVNQPVSDSAATARLRVVHHDADLPPAAPVVFFFAGLDGEPLPRAQVKRLTLAGYRAVSVCHSAADRSEWPELAKDASDVIESDFNRRRERGYRPERVCVVGESFGAALALHAVASLSQRGVDILSGLTLINSGTALLDDVLLAALVDLLPLLWLDPTGRILYALAAAFMFRFWLVDHSRVDATSLESAEGRKPRSLDTRAVPLDAMLHRVGLLKDLGTVADSRTIRKFVQVPTTVVASGQDRLLRSEREAERLGGLLPNVQDIIRLPQSAHGCLLESDVDIVGLIPKRDGGATAVGVSTSTRSARNGQNTPLRRKRPPASFDEALRTGRNVLRPWRSLVAPTFFGRSNVVDAMRRSCANGVPVLFVGNHGVYGILDTPLIIDELNSLLGGARLRPLAYSTHFNQFDELSGGRWGSFCESLGAVPATPRNFYKLLKDKEPVLLFPGGPTEVCKRRGEKNKLLWRDETDFVRPAAKFNAIVVPFSSIGADDSIDILLDGEEMQKLPVLGPMLTRTLKDRGFETN